METRKRLYKATNLGLTMTERVKRDKNRQVEMRNDRFAANRKIDVDVDNSVTTPIKPAPLKISQIKDKSSKLKAYIEQKRTTKLKEKVEQRSPFIPYVPVGRWVERKEPLKKPKAFTISTPIKNALMSDGKIFKKSTIKQIATTARKENATVVKKSKKDEPAKSRKKILTEFNNAPRNEEKIPVKPAQSLDDTFEIIPDQQENILDESVIEILSPQKLPSPFHENVPSDKDAELTEKSVEDEKQIAITVTPVKRSNPIVEEKNEMPVQSNKELNLVDEKKKEAKKQTAKIIVPVKRSTREKKPAKSVESKQVSKIKKKIVKSESAQEKIPKSPVPTVETSEVVTKPVSKKVQSNTYKFYKSSLDNQVAYISIQLKAFTSNLDSFIDKLSEDMQSNIHQTIQQGNLLISEKMKGFGDLLEKFESSPEPKNITEDDIDNYWMMLFDQVEHFKTNLQSIQEAKLMATTGENKRRTRKTILDTPTRRSRRIAETGDTPRHNTATCFGCTPLSASKVNTPKSAKARRTAFKKSIAFEEISKN
ncbi:nucleolar protein dao-5-like [Chironomus tepperi]|uniref:nucleolar protein dao-5-like n=1 Tax=Chironomus tepperi TaxID=113505 RepID=UPI00391F2CB2